MIKSKFMIDKIKAELVICGTQILVFTAGKFKEAKIGSRGTTDREDRYLANVAKGYSLVP